MWRKIQSSAPHFKSYQQFNKHILHLTAYWLGAARIEILKVTYLKCSNTIKMSLGEYNQHSSQPGAKTGNVGCSRS